MKCFVGKCGDTLLEASGAVQGVHLRRYDSPVAIQLSRVHFAHAGGELLCFCGQPDKMELA